MLFGKYVNKFYLKYWYNFLLGIFFLIVVDVAQLYIPQYIGNIVSIFSDADKATLKDNFFKAPLTDQNGFLFFVVALAVIGVVMMIGRAGWRLAINGLGVKVDYDLRDQMFSHAEKLSVSYYKTQKTGTLMAIFNSDLEAVRGAFTDGVICLIDFLCLGGISMYRLFSLDWVMALACVVPLALMASAGGIIGKAITKRYDAQLSSFEELTDFAQEDFSGIAVIKAFVREGHQMLSFAHHNSDYKAKNIRYIRFSIALDSVITLLINSVFVISIFLGGYIVVTNPSFDVGKLTQFVGYLDALIWPMFAIAQLINIISKSYASLKKVSEFLDTPIELKDVKDNKEGVLPPFTGDIVFKDLDFSYPDNASALVLKKIDLHIKPGDNIGIVGRTGSGKSTLVKILLKIYNIPEGKLYFDGVDINDWPAKTVRRNIGYVAQNAFLFSDLIKNNIAFGDESMKEDEVIKAADFACIDKSIEEFKEGYNTIIGEKGTTLSGGQKQRIAMARAIVNNPPVLILDDSVSAVDSDTEKKILQNINTLRKGKTTFIVSSRISSVENMDNIIVMDQGQIVGFGTHEELLKTCPLYEETVRLQELEKEEKPDGRLSGTGAN
ncbi:MAG: ABC transporter ATP-binding protein/permease [Bacilli bacterium]|jgi:ATP-binding cassette subfamily B protein|nr:ABC transporter ATP-binding protein/permease [Bacilli bacterium]